MERTVPTTESEEVELYSRTYYSLLRSTAEVQIRTLEEVHIRMNSLLHPAARQPDPDMSAFLYSLLRLPACISEVQLVVLGQSDDVFARGGYAGVFEWHEVTAPARRRRSFFDGQSTMACFIASRSDIDDMIPLLTAFQIEWNKFHNLLQRLPAGTDLAELCSETGISSQLSELLEVPADDLERLYAIWDEDFACRLEQMRAAPRRLRVKLLSSSYSQYRRATHSWWENIERAAPVLRERPVYFVSSNTHSLVNLVSGFALSCQAEISDYLKQPGNAGLLAEWADIQAGRVASSAENFLYYVFRKYLQTAPARPTIARLKEHQAGIGLTRIPSRRYFDVEAQVIELARLDPASFDPRLQGETYDFLKNSSAVILNVDYPLGLGAYNILTEVAESVGAVLGVYVMGKAATLNAAVGDVMIPNVVHDEHSQNSYLFQNCFSAADVTPYIRHGTVLDNQKAVTVQGTFLQTAQYMDVFYREGYTDIEMEAGPYLSAVYEMHRPTRHPVDEIVNLYGAPFDLGFIHYASDTPLSKGRNLGAGSLSYYGLDSTYASTLAIMQRIFRNERRRKDEG